MSLPSYAVVTPVRDEERFLAITARSMVDQTHRPQQWVIVDDGSVDRTREIAEAFAREHQWITVIGSGQQHARERGAPIVAAFNHGRAALAEQAELVVKMDGDLFLPAHYFEWVASVFEREPRAGIAGGVCLVHDGARWSAETRSRHNVPGPVKTYRVACLEDIGGLRGSMGWDGIDEHGARARGWGVHVLGELGVLHYKMRGSKQSWPRARWEEGRGAHFMGYRASFLLVRAAYRMVVERPPVLGGLVLLAGFAAARLRGAPQVDDPAARASLAAEQGERMRGLSRGRRHRTIAALPGGGPALWAATQAAEQATAAPALSAGAAPQARSSEP